MNIFANMLIFTTERKVEIWLLFISKFFLLMLSLMMLKLRCKFSEK